MISASALASASPWDFSPVFSLLNTFSSKHDATDPSVSQRASPSLEVSSEELSSTDQESSTEPIDTGLGDFSQIWKFLGVPKDSTQPIDIPTTSVKAQARGSSTDVLTSKGVHWQDQYLSPDPVEQRTPSKKLVGSAKTRLRAARRERAAVRALTQNGSVTPKQLVLDVDLDAGTSSSSESDLEFSSVRRPLKFTDRKSIIQNLTYGSSLEDKGAVTTPSTSVSPPKPSLIQAKSKVWPVSAPLSSPLHKLQLQPTLSLNPTERRSRLITKLMSKHTDEESFLNNSSLHDPSFNQHNTSAAGIHVFVDMSNIMIGFHDALKASRDIPLETRIRRAYLSFHNLSLVLERGRPAARRVLAGSDRSPEVFDAGKLGYETNILDRVLKAKELTPRQKKYQNLAGGLSSGSETTAAMFAPEKWVEQGVDEILHLKILESLVDSEKPSTIVLVTGDAAVAEYSDGFLKMVERALNKGWSIELVSFRRNTSYEYRKPIFKHKWGSQFKLVMLDDYAEDLLLGS